MKIMHTLTRISVNCGLKRYAAICFKVYDTYSKTVASRKYDCINNGTNKHSANIIMPLNVLACSPVHRDSTV